MEIVYWGNYFNLTKILVLGQFKMSGNQSAPGLNRGLSWKFWWLKNANQGKFTDMYGEAWFNKKNFTNRLSMDSRQRVSVKKRVKGVETLCLSDNEKFRVQWSEKKVMLTVMKSSITIDFIEKGATVNSASNSFPKFNLFIEWPS